MKRIAVAIAATFTAIAPAAFAQYGTYNSYDNRDNRAYDNRDNRAYDNRYDNRDARDYSGERARVLQVQPVAATASSGREECWNPRAGHYEEVRPEHSGGDKRNLAGTIIGGIAGGVLGHQVGSGRGNTAATVGGAALGAYAGNRVQEHRNDDAQGDLDRTRCRAVADAGTTDTTAYDVRYTWQGREYVARMDHDPGRFVELGRDVNPDGTPYATVSENSWR